MKTRTLFLSTIVLTLIGSFLTRQDQAIAQAAPQNVRSFPSKEEVDKETKRLEELISTTLSKSRSLRDTRNDREKSVIDSFQKSWSAVEPNTAEFLGEWTGAEDRTYVYPSNIKGQVCIIYEILGKNGVETSLHFGGVLDGSIWSDDKYVYVRQNSYLGLITHLSSRTKSTSDLLISSAPRPLKDIEKISNLTNKDQIIQKFNQSGCTASLPTLQISKNPGTSVDWIWSNYKKQVLPILQGNDKDLLDLTTPHYFSPGYENGQLLFNGYSEREISYFVIKEGSLLPWSLMKDWKPNLPLGIRDLPMLDLKDPRIKLIHDLIAENQVYSVELQMEANSGQQKAFDSARKTGEYPSYYVGTSSQIKLSDGRNGFINGETVCSWTNKTLTIKSDFLCIKGGLLMSEKILILDSMINQRNVAESPKDPIVAKKDDVVKPIGKSPEQPPKNVERKVVRTYRNSEEFARLHLGWDDHALQIQKARSLEFGLVEGRADSFFEELKFFKLDQNPACVMDLRGIVDSSLGCQVFTYLEYLRLRQHLAAQNSVINNLNSPESLKATSGIISYLSLRNRQDVAVTYFNEFLSQSRDDIQRRVNEPTYNGIFGLIQPGIESLKKNTGNAIVQTSFIFKGAFSTGLEISPDVLAGPTGNIKSKITKAKDMQSIVKLLGGVLAVESASLIPDLYTAFSPVSGTAEERKILIEELSNAYFIKIVSLAGELAKDPVFSKLEVFVELNQAITLHESLQESYNDNSLDSRDKSILQLYWILTTTKVVGNVCQLFPIPIMEDLGGYLKAFATTVEGVQIASSSRQMADQYKEIENAVKKNNEILNSYEKAYLAFYTDLTDAYIARYPNILKRESDGRISSTNLDLLRLD